MIDSLQEGVELQILAGALELLSSSHPASRLMGAG
jgi:hypothetical protein